MSVLWLLLHAIGYLAIAALAVTRAAPSMRRVSAERRARDSALRTERIARLEIQLGIGLDYGRDWLLSQPIACDAIYRDLVEKGNGACERKCWSCDKKYCPHEEYDSNGGVEPSWYKQTPEDRELTNRLCGSCYRGATRKDFGVIDVLAASE